jgi:TRAP-type C4-dicarboxylate transport system substrate-binding protein
MPGILRTSTAAIGLALLTATGQTASAVEWDMPSHYPAGNFHVEGMQRFADEVEAATNGEVVINVHPGGSLGFKGPDMLAAVRDGLVPIGNTAFNIAIGEEPLFGLEGQPFLISDYDDFEIFHKYFRPVVDKIMAEKHNQKVLYVVPWPRQYLHSKMEVDSIDDIQGVKVRTTQKSVTDMFNRLGMVSVQLPWGEVVPALAAGTIDAVTTSSSSGVDGKFWEFMSHFTPTNHVWNSEMFPVNLDAWNELTPEQQQAIEEVAARLEPEFWEVSRQEDETRSEILIENGMELTPLPDDLRAEMRERTEPMLTEFLANVPEAKPIVEDYFAEIGREMPQ